MKRLLLALLIFFCSLSANAGFYSGNDLYELLQDANGYGTSSAYIIGVADRSDLVREIAICLVNGVKATQLADVTKAYLKDNPEIRHYPAAALVTVALKEAFPCTKNKSD